MPNNHKKSKANSNTEVISQLYVVLMQEIEPDLLPGTVEYLNFIYAGESDEQSKARFERYEKALDLLEERMSYLATKWKEELVKFRDKVLKNAKRRSAEQEDMKIDDISSQIEKV